MSRYEAVPHPHDPKLVYFRKVKDAGEPQVVPAKRPARKSADGVVPAKRPKGEKRVVPAVRPAHPGKVVPVVKNKRLSTSIIYNIERGIFAQRGVDYPEWYNGFMRYSAIRIVKEKENNAECRLLFGPDRHKPLAKTIPFKFPIKFGKDEIATVCFFDGQGESGTTHFEIMEIPWPDQVNTDIFDHIWLERVNNNSVGKDLKIKRIEVILNDVNICNIGWPQYKICRQYLDISPFIERERQDALRYHDNPNSMLKLLAGEFGQAWSPKYGEEWKERLPWTAATTFVPNPWNWCDDFANWAMFMGGKIKNYSSCYHNLDNMNQWLIRHNYFILPYNTPYSFVGQYAKPGYYANPHRHATFFLYWVPPVPSVRFSYDELYDENNLTESLNRYKMVLDDYRPETIGDSNLYPHGIFQPQNDLNWFCHISGSSGDRVRIGVSAVIRLGDFTSQKETVVQWLQKLPNGKIMPWFEKNSRMTISITLSTKIWHGFCRTDGSKNTQLSNISIRG